MADKAGLVRGALIGARPIVVSTIWLILLMLTTCNGWKCNGEEVSEKRNMGFMPVA